MTDTNGRVARAHSGDGADVTTDRGDEPVGRRRVLAATAGVVAVGLAGCSGGEEDDPTATDAEDDGDDGGSAADDGTEPQATDADDNEGDDEGGETPDDDGEGEDVDEEGGEGLHEHGTLYVEVDGDRVDFSEPKYYEEGAHPDGRAGSRFHFHDDGHQYMWHMHDDRLTLQEALEILPDVSYEHDGSHVFELEGETYVDGEDGTSVSFSERGTEIDPREYQLQDQDVVYVTAETGDGG